jgi:hypothetical protein
MRADYGSASADKRIRAYVEHLEAEGPGVPVVSRTADTLRMCYAMHTVAVVDSLLREHWDRQRPAGPVHFG